MFGHEVGPLPVDNNMTLSPCVSPLGGVETGKTPLGQNSKYHSCYIDFGPQVQGWKQTSWREGWLFHSTEREREREREREKKRKREEKREKERKRTQLQATIETTRRAQWRMTLFNDRIFSFHVLPHALFLLPVSSLSPSLQHPPTPQFKIHCMGTCV